MIDLHHIVKVARCLSIKIHEPKFRVREIKDELHIRIVAKQHQGLRARKINS